MILNLGRGRGRGVFERRGRKGYAKGAKKKYQKIPKNTKNRYKKIDTKLKTKLR
jgi:hypothetical protein